MQAEYALWLNGNSLVLVDTTLSESRAEDLLNIQLAAYLSASKRYPKQPQGGEWHREYRRVQASFGCNLDTLQSSAAPLTPAAPYQPWSLLQDNLLASLSAQLQEPVSRCLAAFNAGTHETLQQLPWAESVKPTEATGSCQVCFELRLISPDASITSSELCFASHTPLGPAWLWQTLDPALVQPGQGFNSRYQSNEKLIELIRGGLHNSIKARQAQYRSAISLPQPKEPEHE